MNEELNQTELSPEEAKAALGLSTRLSEQFLMQQAQMEAEQMAMESPVEGEMPQGGEETPQVEEQPEEDKSAQLEGKMDEKMEILRTEMKETMKTEIESLRNNIKSALDNEQD